MSETTLILPDGSVAEIDSSEYEVEVENLGIVVAHANKADSRLIERFKLPVIRAVLAAAAEECTIAENMIWNVLLSRYIDHAEGVSLDYLGNRVGEPRSSQNDPNYRVRIRARVLINRSQGHPEDLYAIIRALGATGRIWNTGDASMRADITAVPANPEVARQIAELLGEATSGGVGLHVTTPTTEGIAAIWDSAYADPGGALWGSEYDPDAGSGEYGHSESV